ncbi:MAG: TIGR00266 family protein [Clostridiales bacterium]|nr:TIGR00266 family protein [Clostridiales bacterium]MBR6484533.1 TIGR00266 family protein [Clostridiales bacterium]
MQYEIKGTPFPVAICTLNNGESLITERGSMSWMSDSMEMKTVGGSVGKALGRMFSGESMFQNKYIAHKDGAFIAFASSFPGEIRAIDIRPGADIIVQKSGFLASEESVELSIAYKKKLGASFFGGEGFIMQKLSGTGTAFVELDGSVCQYELAAGETMYLDTGYLAMMDATVTMDIEMVKGAKNILLGGEGLFNTKVVGPGRVWIQTMPIPTLAQSIIPYIPTKG